MHDFHCVTGWSVVGLRWFGVPLVEVLEAAGVGDRAAPYALVHGADRRRAAFVWDDLTADDVLLAIGLDGAPLDARHGAPFRLVCPGQYGYKNVKHLSRIDLARERPARCRSSTCGPGWPWRSAIPAFRRGWCAGPTGSPSIPPPWWRSGPWPGPGAVTGRPDRMPSMKWWRRTTTR